MGLVNWLMGKMGRSMMKRTPPKIGNRGLCDFGRICYEVRPADVLLIEGHNYISRIIRDVTHSPWTHAALYIGRLHDIDDPFIREMIHKAYKGPANDQLVIESIVGKGTIINNLHHYQYDHIRICRPSGISHLDVQTVIAYAVKNVGKNYNVRHFIDLGRFLLASRFIPRRWKSSLFKDSPKSTTQEICSGMIANAFNAVKFPILPLIHESQDHHIELIKRNPNLYTPSDFDYSPYFNIIKYPIFPITQNTPYRNLPWREDLMYSDEIGISSSKHAPTQKPSKKR